MQWAWIAMGGALGSVLRFLVQGRIQEAYPGAFPIGTLGVNLIGSAAIGLLAGAFAAFPVPSPVKLFLIVGFLGGFTTFSSFSLENLNLIRTGHVLHALVYILVSNGMGILAACGGFFLARAVGRYAGGM